MKGSVREIVFKGFHGCSDGNCIVKGKAKGQHTNGGCRCMTGFGRGELQIIASRLRVIADIEIELPK